MKISFTHDLGSLANILRDHHCKDERLGEIIRDCTAQIGFDSSGPISKVVVTFTEIPGAAKTKVVIP